MCIFSPRIYWLDVAKSYICFLAHSLTSFTACLDPYTLFIMSLPFHIANLDVEEWSGILG